MKNFDKIAAAVLIGVAIAFMTLFGLTAIERSLTKTEAIVFQIISFLASFWGSYVFGRESSINSAKELIKPHARSAFRRLISLYLSIRRVMITTESDNDESLKIEIIKAIAIEQIATANDAMEDWQDIVPEEVDELRKKMEINE